MELSFGDPRRNSVQTEGKALFELQRQEDDFKRMQAMGVRLLRLPVGYWNFVDYKGDEGPEVPEPFKERVKNLHRIASPAEPHGRQRTWIPRISWETHAIEAHHRGQLRL